MQYRERKKGLNYTLCQLNIFLLNSVVKVALHISDFLEFGRKGIIPTQAYYISWFFWPPTWPVGIFSFLTRDWTWASAVSAQSLTTGLSGNSLYKIIWVEKMGQIWTDISNTRNSPICDSHGRVCGLCKLSAYRYCNIMLSEIAGKFPPLTKDDHFY